MNALGSLSLIFLLWLVLAAAEARADVYGYLYRENPGGQHPTAVQGYEAFLFNPQTKWTGPSVTDSYGRFRLEVPSGRYLLRIYGYTCRVWQQEVLSPGRIYEIILPDRDKDISTVNASKFVGGGRWNWTIFIRAPTDVLDKIRYVEYRLHPTFPNPVRRVSQIGNSKQPFALSTNGWGVFKIPVKVVLKNGEVRCLEHMLRFDR